MSILIIAEAGVNHNGNITTAKEMIGVAAKSGADYVKFQTFKAERLATPTSMVAHYQRKTEGLDDLQFQLLKNLELSESAHFELEKSCKEFDIEVAKQVVNKFFSPKNIRVNFLTRHADV